MLSRFSYVLFFVTLWTIAHQAPLSMGFSRQEYWSGLPCPPPGIFPTHRVIRSLKAKGGSPIYFYLFIMAMLGLCCCAWAYSSCGVWAYCSGFSLQSTGSRYSGSVVVDNCLVVPRHVGSSQTREQTRVPCIGRQILIHWATREVPPWIFGPHKVCVSKFSISQCLHCFSSWAGVGWEVILASRGGPGKAVVEKPLEWPGEGGKTDTICHILFDLGLGQQSSIAHLEKC